MKLLVLVIASKEPRYLEFRKMWNTNLSVQNPNLKIVFIYGKSPTKSVHFKSEHDMYLPCEESLRPGIFHKTILAQKWFLENDASWTHLLRTNLTSYFIWDRLFAQLEQLPQQNLAYGRVMFNKRLISGCGITYSRDVVDKIVQNMKPYWTSRQPDDVVLGLILKKENIPFTHYMYVGNKPEDDGTSFHFRFSSRQNRIDLNNYQTFATKMQKRQPSSS